MEPTPTVGVVAPSRPRPPAAGGGGGSQRPRTCVKYFPDLSGETGGSLGIVPCHWC